ncbi:MAG: T9SS type A sorting domain-containing protein, partial [Ignavibacteria bacterium]|nr:T9SS type A sorting domain-containing protein [Ignavibacteria bacterium]
SLRSTSVFNLTIIMGPKLTDVSSVVTPKTFELSQNYPNPFNPSTRIKYQIPSDSYVNLEVFNVVGQKVATLVNTEKKAGYYEVTFDAKDLQSGVYFFKLTAGDFVSTKKMMLLK